MIISLLGTREIFRQVNRKLVRQLLYKASYTRYQVPNYYEQNCINTIKTVKEPF